MTTVAIKCILIVVGCVWGRANITTHVAYIVFVYRNGWGCTKGWIPTVSLQWKHTPNQSLSDPKALCHDNSLAVMTTVAMECDL